MNKFLMYVMVFLLLEVYIVSSLYIEQGRKISALETNLNAYKGNISYLKREIEKRNRKELEASERIQELEKAAANDKTGFDWYYDISSSLVVKRLRQD